MSHSRTLLFLFLQILSIIIFVADVSPLGLLIAAKLIDSSLLDLIKHTI